MIGSKPLSIRFDKVDGFIWVYDRTRYLVLFWPEKYDAIYNRMRYLISQKMVWHMSFFIIMQEPTVTHTVICINDVYFLNDITILNIWGVDCCFIINGICKSDTINLLQNVNLTKKREIL